MLPFAKVSLGPRAISTVCARSVASFLKPLSLGNAEIHVPAPARPARAQISDRKRTTLAATGGGGVLARTPPVPMFYETTSLSRLVSGRGGFDG